MRDLMDDDNMHFESGADLVLAPILDVRAAVPLHRELLDRRGASIVVDASAVERIGGQCAAILLSARRSWSSDGHELRIAGTSPALQEGLKLLGIDPAEIGSDGSDDFARQTH